MKSNYFILFVLLVSMTLDAQTVIWNSDCEDVSGFTSYNADGDVYNGWQYGLDADLWGFAPGHLLYSQAANGYSDHVLTTPSFYIPENAIGLEFKVRVASFDAIDFSEHFTIYIVDFDNNDINALIHDEILTEGGHGTARIITAAIPDSFSGRNAFIFLRHFDSLYGSLLMVDDFEVTYSEILSTYVIENDIKLYPNPTDGLLHFKGKDEIDKILVINQLGQNVMIFSSNEILNNQINISGLRSGIYTIKIYTEHNYQTLRIFKN